MANNFKTGSTVLSLLNIFYYKLLYTKSERNRLRISVIDCQTFKKHHFVAQIPLHFILTIKDALAKITTLREPDIFVYYFNVTT